MCKSAILKCMFCGRDGGGSGLGGIMVVVIVMVGYCW